MLPLLLLAGCILIETVEQMLYRMGGRQRMRTRYLAFVAPATALNLVSLGLWLLVLRYLALGQALPLLAANNVTVALTGKWMFGEVIRPRRWIGVFLIVTGFALVAMNEQ
jgi:drug/metabolite transporter (DMT)-like permease